MHNLAVLYAMGATASTDNESAATLVHQGGRAWREGQPVQSRHPRGQGRRRPAEPRGVLQVVRARRQDGRQGRGHEARRDRQLRCARTAGEGARHQPNSGSRSPSTPPKPMSSRCPTRWQTISQAKTASVDMKKAMRNIQLILNKNGYDAGRRRRRHGPEDQDCHHGLPERQRPRADREGRRKAGGSVLLGKEVIASAAGPRVTNIGG
jgi:localization factor PodJL